MRYFLEYKKEKVIGWLVKNTNPKHVGLIEVEPQTFKRELEKMGVEYILPEDKIETLGKEKAELEMALIELAKKQSEENEYRTQLEVALVELAKKVGGE
ncbi:hypothetical protein [Clostridium algidicarnis]|uniref:hypothetical protein n=1 Tax=Clostridium algidicarnis TaxID=37659 RepID=UPI001C0B1E46|nr:hypothetical protein [Clostridium algidicarnis]MBU3226814.1 hypothetical protein [Clostridium algidicarnis]MBU3250275.1 hypothetical protein [Clostridium algidicarnis]